MKYVQCGSEQCTCFGFFLCIVASFTAPTYIIHPEFPGSLIDFFSLCACVPVPRRDHQKHPGGGGDGHPWSTVLSARCHRLGYKGSGDPHGISERGKHVMCFTSQSVWTLSGSQKHSGVRRAAENIPTTLCHHYFHRLLHTLRKPVLWFCRVFLSVFNDPLIVPQPGMQTQAVHLSE